MYNKNKELDDGPIVTIIIINADFQDSLDLLNKNENNLCCPSNPLSPKDLFVNQHNI